MTPSPPDEVEREGEAFEKRLAKLNRLAKDIDEGCDSIHPTAWAEHNRKAVEEWKRLAKKL